MLGLQKCSRWEKSINDQWSSSGGWQRVCIGNATASGVFSHGYLVIFGDWSILILIGVSAQTAITKYRRLFDSNNRNLYLNSGG